MKFVFRNLVVMLVLGAVSVYCSLAQSTYTVQGGASTKKSHIGKKLQEMKETLSLSDEQVSKIQSLTKESREKAKGASAETDAKAKREASKKRSEELAAAIKGVLTPEQAKKYEQWKSDEKAERKQKRAEKKKQK